MADIIASVPKPKQSDLVQQGGQPGAVGEVEPDPLPIELALQHLELVTEGEDLYVLVSVAAWQQP